jgi:hypothetical protein
VRAGEGAGALLFALNLFLLLASYYMLKTAREALILSEGGAEVKSYSAAGQAILLLVIIPLYGAFIQGKSRAPGHRSDAVLPFESGTVHRVWPDGLPRRDRFFSLGGRVQRTGHLAALGVG